MRSGGVGVISIVIGVTSQGVFEEAVGDDRDG
ncbi:hypothetical protein JOE68_002838 [Saccharothrix algeriensis]|uniref:Uncharacterized protein n=1 Tax=Saccharothrix algeriensis TaxID=173560 RepID=A0ABS2S9K8_9PSEU|nr:hypothetical protein [Saccharothrix algeriensis]